MVEATPYQGEPLPTPRPAAATLPIAPKAAPSSSGPASAVDCTEGAPRELAADDSCDRTTAAENTAFLCAVFPYNGRGASSSPSDYEESPAREPLMQRRATPSPEYEPGDDDVPTAAGERQDPRDAGAYTRTRREVERELAAEVRAHLDVIDERRRRKRTRLARERDEREWEEWCTLLHSVKERLFAERIRTKRLRHTFPEPPPLRG